MEQAYRGDSDVYVLPTHFPIPGAGVLPINAFVILAEEPVLVDTGLAIDRTAFLAALESVIDPRALRWVWLTHDDMDHTGSVEAVMEIAPQARLITNALGAMRMGTWWPVPMERVYAVTPGDSIDVGDRALMAVRPPFFDNPMSTGIYDTKTGSLFSVDSFGAIIPFPAHDADEIPPEALAGGMVAWATFDSPWCHLVDQEKFGQVLERVRQLAPTTIFSSHLPPARGATERLLKILAGTPNAEPFAAPNQAALEAMLADAAVGTPA